MSAFWGGVAVILSLELRQRVRGIAWYVLLGVFVFLVAIVTVLLKLAFSFYPTGGEGVGDSGGASGGGAIFSAVIYFVLLLGTLVAPALSGTAINGDRDSGTLATTQVTLITTGQLLLGKFLAAWLTALAFLAAALPFLIYAAIQGGIDWATMIVSALVLIFELGIVAAIGVGLSGILNRPLFSIVVSYLVVAALSVGTLIAFGLGGVVVQSQVVGTERTFVNEPTDGSAGSELPVNPDAPMACGPPTVVESTVPRFDHFWGILVANPYVLLADAVPTQFDTNSYPVDLFGVIKMGVRSVQIAPDLHPVNDYCKDFAAGPNAKQIINSTAPGWAVGMALHLLLALGSLFWAYRRTRTPSGKLPTGTRIA